MNKLRAYAFLSALLLFIAYFGVYGFYTMLAGSIGQFWAFVGAGLIAFGTLVIAAVGITMIKSRPPALDEAPEE